MKRVSKIVVCTLIFSLLCGTVAFAMDNAISNVLRAKVNVAEIKYEGQLLELSGKIKGKDLDSIENVVSIDAEKGEKLNTMLKVKLADEYGKGELNPKVEGVQIAIEISNKDGEINKDDFLIDSKESVNIEERDTYCIAYIGPKEGFDVSRLGKRKKLKIKFDKEAEYDLVFYAVFAKDVNISDESKVQDLIKLTENLPDNILDVRNNLEDVGKDIRTALKIYENLSEEQKESLDEKDIQKLKNVWSWVDGQEKFRALDVTKSIYAIPEITDENVGKVKDKVQKINEIIDKMPTYQKKRLEDIQDEEGNYLKPLERLEAIETRLSEL